MTGEMTISMPTNKPVETMETFHLAMEHFRHVVRAKDYLTETECHALFVWISQQLVMGRPLLIVERTLIELLSCLDTDMSQEMGVLVRTEARNMLNHQADTAKTDD